MSKEVVYKWSYINYENVASEDRLHRFGHEVIKIKENRLIVRYNMFSYSKFDRNRTIFGAPSQIDCFHEDGMFANELPRSITEIISAFK